MFRNAPIFLAVTLMTSVSAAQTCPDVAFDIAQSVTGLQNLATASICLDEASTELEIRRAEALVTDALAALDPVLPASVAALAAADAGTTAADGHATCGQLSDGKPFCGCMGTFTCKWFKALCEFGGYTYEGGTYAGQCRI